MPDTIYHEKRLSNIDKTTESDNSNCYSSDDVSSDEDDMGDIPANTNRRPVYYEVDSTSDSDSDW